MIKEMWQNVGKKYIYRNTQKFTMQWINTLWYVQITKQNEQTTIKHKNTVNLINKMSRRNYTQKNM